MRCIPAIVAFTTALLALRCDPGCRNDACAGARAPTAVLQGVAPGTRVGGAIALTAAAGDDVGVVSVDFSVDGRVFATAWQAPWSATWNSFGSENGGHALSATAHDADGNAGASAPVPVTVLNAVGASVSVHTALGLPGPASNSVESVTAYLSVKPQYVLSYDGARMVPNWVSWELNARWLGSVARQDDFRPDDTFPEAMPQARLSDYAGSGWDRGHLCPSEDRTATVTDNRSTFYLTNMVPQADAANGGPWAHLEAYLRQLAGAGKELSVVAGGVLTQPPRTIGAGVAVPSATFKVAVVLDRPGQGIVEVAEQTRVISVLIPNDASVSRTADWRSFR
ncbi:MAG TPA: DNA/RNA non-specific endonuclease, partial [Myxococcales bacterium]|nr:DNA/RNA non-specific endonuclease [Myxococcales bacterium]